MFQNKKGIMDMMVALAYGAMMFVILIVVATAVGQQMGSAVASCPSGYGTYNTSLGVCHQPGFPANTTAASAAATNSFYVIGQLGQGGLSGYLPLIFIAVIAVAIIGMLGFNVGAGKGKGKY